MYILFIWYHYIINHMIRIIIRLYIDYTVIYNVLYILCIYVLCCVIFKDTPNAYSAKTSAGNMPWFCWGSRTTTDTIHIVPSCSCAVLNGSSHSPTSLNGAPSTPNGFSNGPAMSSTASLSNQQLPPACGARQLCKLKRFLTTLQQFGNDISPEIGERVRSLVLGLVVSFSSHLLSV